MLNQKNIAISFLMIIYLLISYQPIQAETTFVNDCFNGNSDCLEELDTSEENNQEEKSFSTTETSSLGFSVFKVIVTLLFILILIYLILKFLSKRQSFSKQARSLENLGGISVGQNKSVQMIRVGTHVYMIGVGENVEMLKEITDPEVIDSLLHNYEERDSGASSLITSLFQKKQVKDSSSENHSNQKFVNLFSEELEKLKQTRQQIKGQHIRREDVNE